MFRPSGRALDELRPVSFLPGIAPHATGSVLVSFGLTRVICSACIEEGVPPWMRHQGVPGGWLTAEYSMLPYSTGGGRKPRDSSRGKVDGRSTEIQRLIGRSLRAVVDLEALGQRTLWVDCDVLQADGGTRTASITGASVAVELALLKLRREGQLTGSFPLKKRLAAISVGIYKNEPVLDLDYPEDSEASVDANVVMTEDLDFVELQSSGEEATFSTDQLAAMLVLARKGIAELLQAQAKAMHATEEPAGAQDLSSLATLFKP